LRPNVLFCDFLWKKALVFSPKSGGNFPYKYRFPHSLFLVQNEAVQKEVRHYELLGGVSLLSLQVFLEYVLVLL
jgi:hypothetical protein